MKKFLTKRWHGIPVGIIATILLVGVVAAAGYQFLSATITTTVAEPIKVEYDWEGNNSWVSLQEGTTIDITGVWPGSSHSFPLRISSEAPNDLRVAVSYTVIAAPTDGWNKVSITSSLPNLIDGGILVSKTNTRTPTITMSLEGEAPSGNYQVKLNFTRTDP